MRIRLDSTSSQVPEISPLFFIPGNYTLDPELPQIGLIKDATNVLAHWLILTIEEPMTRTCQPENRIMEPIAPSLPNLGEPTSQTSLSLNILSGEGACQLGVMRVSLTTDGTERKS